LAITNKPQIESWVKKRLGKQMEFISSIDVGKRKQMQNLLSL